jgi:hypothetical protein
MPEEEPERRRIADRHLDLLERTLLSLQNSTAMMQTSIAVVQTSIADHIRTCEEREKKNDATLAEIKEQQEDIKRQQLWMILSVSAASIVIIGWLLTHGLPYVQQVEHTL